MKQKIEKIINGNKTIHIDKEDFGNIDDIKFHKTIEVNNVDEFKFEISNKDKEKVKELIVHIFTKEHLKIEESAKVIDEVRNSFNHNIDIIFGIEIDKEINNIVIDVFGK